MRTENIAYLLAVAAAFASCTKETAPEILISQDPVHEVCLKVGIEGSEDGTRTIVQSGGSVVWNYNEESISVFTAPGTQWKFTKKPGSGPTAEFTGGFSGSPSSEQDIKRAGPLDSKALSINAPLSFFNFFIVLQWL